MPKVAIYTTPTCSYCKLTKEYFKENKVEYREYDVSQDTAKAEEMVAKTGQMGVPVISIQKDGKEQFIVGFDKDKLDTALGL